MNGLSFIVVYLVLVSREMEIEIIVRCYFIVVRIVYIKMIDSIG